MAKHESAEMKKEEREEKEERHEKRAEGGAAKHMTHGGMREVSDGGMLDSRGPMPGMGHKRRAKGGSAGDGEAEYAPPSGSLPTAQIATRNGHYM